MKPSSFIAVVLLLFVAIFAGGPWSLPSRSPEFAPSLETSPREWDLASGPSLASASPSGAVELSRALRFSSPRLLTEPLSGAALPLADVQTLPAPLAQKPAPGRPESAPPKIKFREVVSPNRVTGVFVLPNEDLLLEALPVAMNDKHEYVLEASGGQGVQLGPTQWRWKAPQEPGLYAMQVLDPVSQDSTLLNAFVMLPFDCVKSGSIGSYRIGDYPNAPKARSTYNLPRGFIEVTAENEETLVSPHFKLKQFVCKQPHGHPKYVVLQETLLLTLENILEELGRAGYEASTLHVMSGYRTPHYNKAIGNVQYSCHQWGAAADIFLDRDGDEMMDDLNHDGEIDIDDAAILYDIIDAIPHREHKHEPFPGGLARYGTTTTHGPFVHVDVRGVRARWNT